MMCKTGCGSDTQDGTYLCRDDMARWGMSPEWVRSKAGSDGDVVSDVAFVDFCTRLRAERLNGGRATPPTQER